MQHSVIVSDEPWSVPLEEKLLPQYLKEVGYQTHIVGKWHLGFAKKSFLPTRRGFDSHVGILGPSIGYFDYAMWYTYRPYPPGFDFRRNETVDRSVIGEYATDVLTREAVKVIEDHNPKFGPLFLYLPQVAPHCGNPSELFEAIPEDLATVTHIRSRDRRTYAAMVKALDRSVGEIVKALKNNNMLKNTIILFYSDNGGPTIGPHSVPGSNYPLRGQKNSPWEGGVVSPALVWSPLLQKRHYVSNHAVHSTDWLPTFIHVADASTCNMNIDGINIWQTVSLNKRPSRREILHNIDPIIGYSSYYSDGWKYINGTTAVGKYDYWLGEIHYENDPKSSQYAEIVMRTDVWKALDPFAKRKLRARDVEALRKKTAVNCGNQSSRTRCNPLEAPCLYHLTRDPCEINNLAEKQPKRLQEMARRVEEFRDNMMPPKNLPADPKSNPDLHDGVWT
uniref:Sulfatase N-terminal domain-containing protein n=1 Tax=Lutzomyia longipalpis TaxID=7200 RepID=A0A1B0CXZ0_LUTLO